MTYDEMDLDHRHFTAQAALDNIESDMRFRYVESVEQEGDMVYIIHTNLFDASDIETYVLSVDNFLDYS